MDRFVKMGEKEFAAVRVRQKALLLILRAAQANRGPVKTPKLALGYA